MFEFTGRLKTLSIALMIIGAIAIVASFFTEVEHHEEGIPHGDHPGVMEETQAQTQGEAFDGLYGDTAEEHFSDIGAYEIDEDPNDKYHKTAARAIPENNHYYKTQNIDHEHPEEMHHKQQNMPWANLLVNNFFFLAISLGALFFMAVQYAAQVGWTAVLLRIMEAMTSFLWIPMLIMFILMFAGIFHFGGNHIWHWMDASLYIEGSETYDEIIAGKRAYLNPTFFIIRSVVYALGWIGAAILLRKLSMKFSDSSVDIRKNWIKMRNWSAGFLVFFAITSSTSAWDWFMSIDTHWFSTLYGWYTFATMFVSALTAMTLITIYLKNKGYLPEVNDSHIHDLGKFMFAFSVFWTYLWFSQFMLIWYGNIPEEVTYYMIRFGEYKWLFLTMVGLNFIFPVLVLMSRDSKRNFGFLLVAGLVIIFGHWLDIFIMVMPGAVGSLWEIGLVQIGTLLGYAGLFIFVVFRSLAKRPLMIKDHPMYIESKHFHI